MTAIVLRDVTVDFAQRGLRALDGIDLEIAGGEHVALLGASGAGKTTLLRVVLGAVRPTTGTVRIGGHNPSGSRTEQRAVRTATGLVGQGGDLVLGMSGRFNAVSGTAASWSAGEWLQVLRGRVPARLASRLQGLAADHGVSGCLDAPVAQLSGGQRQRIALLRALLPEPHLLLADEPTAGLDPEAAARVVDAIRSTDARTVIVSTHDVAVARSFPRVIALRGGRLIHDGPGVDPALIYGTAS